MPPSLQIDAQSITTWEDLAGNTKRSAIKFERDNLLSTPYFKFSMGDAEAAIRVTNLATPTADSDATNKAYVDAAIQGLTIKAPVRAVAVGNADIATAYAAGQSVDGVTLAAGDRLLLAGQTNPVENGVYVVAASGAPARTADIPVGLHASGLYVFVDQGTTYLDRSFVCTADKNVDVVGTDALPWVQFGARPSAYKGFGLAMGAANALDVDYTVIPVLANTQTFTGNNTFSGTVVVNNTITTNSTLTAPKVTNLTTASIVGDTDATNVAYVRTQLLNTTNAQPSKAPARAAAPAHVDLALVAAGDVVDGVTLAAADRLLLIHQTLPAQNGLYAVGASAGLTARTADLPAGAHASNILVVVAEGTLHADRLFVCTAVASADVVGTHDLPFVPLAHTLPALAGTALTGNTTDLRLDVRTDNSTLETDVATNNLRLKDLGITNAKIADGTVANAKLVHPQVQVKVLRGLLRTTTDGTTTAAPVTDTVSAADYGLTVPLGANVGVAPDFTVVPDLAATNTFANANTFQGAVTISNTTATTSQTTGALVVTGGLGVGGDIYCANSYNMSDIRLKDKVQALGDDALTAVMAMRGCTFVWNERMPGLEGQPAVGVIAQEVAAAAPLVVSQNGDAPYLAVEYSKIVPYLIESVKTLKRTCDTLSEELAATKRART